MSGRLAVRATDAGRVSIFLAITLTAVLVVIGVAVDSGGLFRTRFYADNVAAEAARAAGQAVDIPAAVRGHATRADPAAARTAAEAYLTNAGVTGIVTISPDGQRVTVTVTVVYQTEILHLINIDRRTVTGTATAALITG